MHAYPYPRPAVTVDLVALRVFSGRFEVLLIKRDRPPFKGTWTLPGGFVHDREPLDSSAVRVLHDKAQVADVFLEQLYTFGEPRRDPRDRVISIAYFAVLPPDYDYDGVGEWHDVHQVPSLGFDHDAIIATARARVQAKLEYTPLGLEFVARTFTLGTLQKTWEAILDKRLDKRNFRKTIVRRLSLIDTGQKAAGGAHAPARLYRKP